MSCTVIRMERQRLGQSADDWPVISALDRKGKISFTSELVRDRFEAAAESAIMKGHCRIPRRTRRKVA